MQGFARSLAEIAQTAASTAERLAKLRSDRPGIDYAKPPRRPGHLMAEEAPISPIPRELGPAIRRAPLSMVRQTRRRPATRGRFHTQRALRTKNEAEKSFFGSYPPRSHAAALAVPSRLPFTSLNQAWRANQEQAGKVKTGQIRKKEKLSSKLLVATNATARREQVFVAIFWVFSGQVGAVVPANRPFLPLPRGLCHL